MEREQGSPSRRLVLWTIAVFLLSAASLALSAPRASALETHLFQGSFGPDGTSSTVFGRPGPVAVDQATGTIYVADETAGTVEKFNAAHEPEAFAEPTANVTAGRLTGFQFQNGPTNEIAVSPTSHDFYVLGESQAIKAYQSDGEPALFTAAPFAGTNEIQGHELCGVVVDSNGDIYASEPGVGVQIYAPTGEPLATATAGVICQVAVDSNGAVYVTNFRGAVEKLTPSEFPVTKATTYSSAGAVDECACRGVAVDPSTNHVFVSEPNPAPEKPNQIAEYDQAGARLDTFGGSEPGALSAIEGLAVNGATGNVYASDGQGKRQVEIFGALVLVPDVTTGQATNLTPSSLTLNGVVNPSGLPVTECAFEYGTSTAYGKTVPCKETLAQINGAEPPVPVHADLTGLSPNTAYHFRILATNANGTNRGEDQSSLTPSPPLIESLSVANVTGDSADLQAQINPLGSPTTYHFEYGSTAAYGQSAPVPSVSIGAGQTPESVTTHLEGLLPGTTYHYRVAAESTVGAATGPDRTFTTQPLEAQEGLPDARIWEMVSPPNKYGAQILPLEEAVLAQASVGGDAITYPATAPIEAEPQGNGKAPQALSRRTAAGWSSQSIAIPFQRAQGVTEGKGSEYRFFSEDLAHALLQPFGAFPTPGSPASLSSEASEQTPYLRTNYLDGNQSRPCTGSCYEPLVTGAAAHENVPLGTVFGLSPFGAHAACPPEGLCGPQFVGATPDSSHVVLDSYLGVGLTPGTNGGLYEWAAGKLTFIGTPVPILPAENSFEAISGDGLRVIFTGTSEGHDGLLLRDLSGEKTVQLDAAEAECEKSGCVGGGGNFEFASSDASKIFFTDTHRLTKDAGASGSEPDLYECEMVTVGSALRCVLSDVTASAAAGEHANVPGVLGISRDGSWIYFVAGGKLASGGQEHAACSAGMTCNLYVRHEGVTRLVALLSGDDVPDWRNVLVNHTSRVSPGGEWLTFMSQRPLTGYDNRDAVSGQHDEEVYLYHASTGKLVCASCNPTGARPLGVEYEQISQAGAIAGGSTVWEPNRWIAANVPGWTAYHNKSLQALYQSRYLSDNGRLFFNSSEALLARDVNGTEDVYQYEPVGVPAGPAACSTASVTYSSRSGGCVALISSGESKDESAFLDASATGGRDAEGHEGGGDVFFLTSAKLSPQDFDSSLDIYDAHECSASSPCIPPAAVPPADCATADSCRATPSSQPSIFGPPSSATFFGTGNAVPQPGPSKPGPLTTRQKLLRALKACRKKHGRARAGCERRARARYAPHKKAKHSAHPGRKGNR